MRTLVITIDVTDFTAEQIAALAAEMQAQAEGNEDHPDAGILSVVTAED